MDVLLSFFLAVLGILVSVVIWAASTHAARIQARESRAVKSEGAIDLEALHSVIKVYETTIQQLEDEVRRLREEARSFQEKAIGLQAELQHFREKMQKDRAAAESAFDTGPQPVISPTEKPVTDS